MSPTAEQKLAAAHSALLKTRGIQFDFGHAPPQPPPPGWVKPLLEFLQAIAPVFKYLFWGGLALGGAFLVYVIVREFTPDAWFRGKRQPVVATDWRPEADAARALLSDADALAAEGRYDEAIHILLFRSIDELAGRRPGAVRPALTSRDIAGLEVLPPKPREAFTRLAQAVERTFFGGRPADAATFGAARADYEAFAFSEAWR